MTQQIFYYLVKAKRLIINHLAGYFEHLSCRVIFYGQNIQLQHFETNGIPYVMVAIGGKCSIGNNFQMNNGLKGNPIGRPQKCVFFVDKGADLIIGQNVGISQTAIICHHQITIGNNVKIGGGVCIYDTDFHSLDPNVRNSENDRINAKKRPVVIHDNVFIGSHSTILKGVTIGENSVIGACSIVTKDIPRNEIWAGNPAHFIKKIV